MDLANEEGQIMPDATIVRLRPWPGQRFTVAYFLLACASDLLFLLYRYQNAFFHGNAPNAGTFECSVRFNGGDIRENIV